MHYVFLVIGILTEICGSTLLKFTDGFKKSFWRRSVLLATVLPTIWWRCL